MLAVSRGTHFTIGILLVLVGGVLFLVFGATEPRYPTAGTTIIVFGDSLAEGQGATMGNDIASLLSVRLGKPVMNMGVSGNTTADGLARVDTVLAQDPRVVVVLLGGNDALRQIPVEDTFTNLSTIIERMQKAGVAVVLVAEPGGLSGPRYVTEYERLAKEYHTFFVSNILHGLIGRSEYMSDAIHPNDAGYAKATDRIEPEVRRALGGGR